MSTDDEVFRTILLELRSLKAEVRELSQRLEKPLPESVGTSEAARLLGICEKTLKEKRPQMIPGIHYKQISPRKILWNPRLIDDGLNTGFRSAAHLRACEAFAKAQPSNQRKGKR